MGRSLPGGCWIPSSGARRCIFASIPYGRTSGGLAVSLRRSGYSMKPLAFPQGAAVVEGNGSPAAVEEFQEGLFHVQDLSAQLACWLLEAQPGQTVCDCCAAPGGKSFTLAESMENTGTLYAFDLYKGRVGLIQQGGGTVAAFLHSGGTPGRLQAL